jgi:hypothetical protein
VKPSFSSSRIHLFLIYGLPTRKIQECKSWRKVGEANRFEFADKDKLLKSLALPRGIEPLFQPWEGDVEPVEFLHRHHFGARGVRRFYLVTLLYLNAGGKAQAGSFGTQSRMGRAKIDAAQNDARRVALKDGWSEARTLIVPLENGVGQKPKI